MFVKGQDVKALKTLLPEKTDFTSVESAPTKKFQEVLSVDTVAPDDDYFLIGDDSLGTVEIVTWAEKHFNISIEISCVFDYPSISSLAVYVHEKMGEL